MYQKFLGMCITLIATIILFSVGCDHPPSGFPDVVPVVVEIVDNSVPIENVNVVLTPTTSVENIVCGGKSDLTGRVPLFTSWASYRKSGVPKGEYRITLIEEISVPQTKTMEEYKAMSESEQLAYDKERTKQILAIPRKIPAELSDVMETPIIWIVDPKNNVNFRINVADYRK
ncbi:MAG: hypothetical protein LBC20_12045 [Planctomycetaceae bacterium]|jgi:hypothetical protein|nr:hypothetical protein [Planctomycetaceae bacterium]